LEGARCHDVLANVRSYRRGALHALMRRLHLQSWIIPMTTKKLVLGIAATLVVAGCATRDPMPFPVAKDCYFLACSMDVEIVEDGSGGKRLKLEADGNVRMGTRHRYVAIIWNLRTPGYEFHGDSVRPHNARSAQNKPVTNLGEWQQQILPNGYWYDNYSVTNLNSERITLSYDLTVYPSFGTPGPPISINPAIVNDSFQGRDHGWLMMR
jgi:hypothetical protein